MSSKMIVPRWKKEKHEIVCDRCSYKWRTSSVMMTVSCTNCGHKVLNPNYNPEKLGIGKE